MLPPELWNEIAEYSSIPRLHLVCRDTYQVEMDLEARGTRLRLLENKYGPSLDGRKIGLRGDLEAIAYLRTYDLLEERLQDIADGAAIGGHICVLWDIYWDGSIDYSRIHLLALDNKHFDIASHAIENGARNVCEEIGVYAHSRRLTRLYLAVCRALPESVNLIETRCQMNEARKDIVPSNWDRIIEEVKKGYADLLIEESEKGNRVDLTEAILVAIYYSQYDLVTLIVDKFNYDLFKLLSERCDEIGMIVSLVAAGVITRDMYTSLTERE